MKIFCVCLLLPSATDSLGGALGEEEKGEVPFFYELGNVCVHKYMQTHSHTKTLRQKEIRVKTIHSVSFPMGSRRVIRRGGKCTPQATLERDTGRLSVCVCVCVWERVCSRKNGLITNECVIVRASTGKSLGHNRSRSFESKVMCVCVWSR